MQLRHMTVRVWERGDTVFGQLTLPLRAGGQIAVQLSITSKQVIQALHRVGFRFTQQTQQQIAGLFGSIGKFIKKVAKSSIVKGIVKGAKSLAPIVKMVVPGAAQALEAANMGLKLIKAARGGNPKAKLALKAATAQAELENKAGKQLPIPSGVRARGPAAANAFRYMVTVQRAAA